MTSWPFVEGRRYLPDTVVRVLVLGRHDTYKETHSKDTDSQSCYGRLWTSAAATLGLKLTRICAVMRHTLSRR